VCTFVFCSFWNPFLESNLLFLDCPVFGVHYITPTDSPPGYPSTGGLYQPDYAPDGSIVFEAEWDGEQIWRLPPEASIPVLISDQFSNDNSPCILPDGRVVSLWLDRDGGNGLHEIKIMSSDGSSFFMLLPNIDIVDAGLGCGE